MRVGVVSRVLVSGIGVTLFGLVFSVVWSIIYDFESSTATHCKPKVYNFVPSVSAAIGSTKTQRCVYAMCICLASCTFWLDSVCCYRWHLSYNMGKYNQLYKRLVQLTITCHVMEKLGLATLSMVSSTDNFDIHEASFVVFVVFSFVYMLLTCSLTHWTHKAGHYKVTQQEKRNLHMKTGMFILSLTIFLTSVYMYLRHNAHCEPHVYSYFAILEYLTIVTNIAFHGMCMLLDYNHYSISDLGATCSDIHVQQNNNKPHIASMDALKRD